MCLSAPISVNKSTKADVRLLSVCGLRLVWTAFCVFNTYHRPAEQKSHLLVYRDKKKKFTAVERNIYFYLDSESYSLCFLLFIFSLYLIVNSIILLMLSIKIHSLSLLHVFVSGFFTIIEEVRLKSSLQTFLIGMS